MKTTVMIDGRRVKIADVESMEKLTVTGDLDFYDTNLKKLPEGLSVGGYLYLSGTSITALPEGLSVGGYLDLDLYPVTFPSPGRMKIGCENHLISEWESFTDSQISAMDRATARKFWAKWKTTLIAYAKAVNARAVKAEEAA